MISKTSGKLGLSRDQKVLRRLINAGLITYRRREKNTDKKPENIASWLNVHGEQFDHTVVKDADSKMTATSIKKMIWRLERRAKHSLGQDGIGLIQVQRRFGKNQRTAPLTSMYLKGPMLSAVSDDFRPRVHDSNDLVIQNAAREHLWRPIANPRQVEMSAFVDTSLKTFCLYQTTQEFESFQDPEARYHDRPSAKVEQQAARGADDVMLVEIPTGDEFMDNIVAFWRPQEVLVAGQEYRLAYRLTWTRDQPDVGHLPAFLHESRGREHHRPGYRRYVIDVATQAEDATSDLSVSEGGETTGVSIFKLPDQDVIRITFLFLPGDQQTCEIRLSLRAADGSPLNPVWLRRWTPLVTKVSDGHMASVDINASGRPAQREVDDQMRCECQVHQGRSSI